MTIKTEFSELDQKARARRFFDAFKHAVKMAALFTLMLLIMCPIGRTNCGTGGSGGLPDFTYTGTYTLIDDGDGNWRIKFLTSGTFTPSKAYTLDVFLAGGGGGSASTMSNSTGAGGGYTRTENSIVAQSKTSYSIVVGAGGSIGSSGGLSSAFSYEVNGGYPGQAGSSSASGGSGGSGGGGDANPAPGGSNGSNGTGARAGIGQGTTTREFGEATGNLYAGGGGAYFGLGGAGGGGDGDGITGSSKHNGTSNTGGGAGAYNHTGGSGIVIIRNHRAA